MSDAKQVSIVMYECRSNGLWDFITDSYEEREERDAGIEFGDRVRVQISPDCAKPYLLIAEVDEGLYEGREFATTDELFSALTTELLRGEVLQ